MKCLQILCSRIASTTHLRSPILPRLVAIFGESGLFRVLAMIVAWCASRHRDDAGLFGKGMCHSIEDVTWLWLVFDFGEGEEH